MKERKNLIGDDSFPIFPDFEREYEMDKMYLIEKEQEMIEEWQQWEEQQEKLPAKIVIKTKKEQYEKRDKVRRED